MVPRPYGPVPKRLRDDRAGCLIANSVRNDDPELLLPNHCAAASQRGPYRLVRPSQSSVDTSRSRHPISESSRFRLRMLQPPHAVTTFAGSDQSLPA
jgi:hypothetical protein